MNKKVGVILVAFVLIFAAILISKTYLHRSSSSLDSDTSPDQIVKIVPGARTLYEGSVGIETISFSEIKKKLEEQSCHMMDPQGNNTNNNLSPCLYAENEYKNSIDIYPHGIGFGPLSFSVTTDRLSAQKDIPGVPDIENFKKEVRQDVEMVGGVVEIKEDTWQITKTKYPWTAVY